MQEKTNYIDIVQYITTLPGSYPEMSMKQWFSRLDPIDKKAESVLMAKEVSYIFDKWNVSKPDRKKIIELLINIKELQ